MLVQRFICFILGLVALSMAQVGYAAVPNGASEKERLVLMPLRVDAADEKMRGAFEVALIEGLTQKYEVFAGEKVRQKAKEVFERESASANEVSRDCDETRCLQNIAAAFQAELIAIANVTRDSDGYIVTLSITNIFDEKSVYSKSLPCTGCGNFQVIKKLKELSGVTVKVEDEHYYWSIGISQNTYHSSKQPDGTEFKGSGTSLHLDYDISNKFNWPVFLRIGIESYDTTQDVLSYTIDSGGIPIQSTNTLTDSNLLTSLSANYVFLADNDKWHPFLGVGLGYKSIQQSCSPSCVTKDQSFGVTLLNLALQYNLTPGFNIEVGFHADSDEYSGTGVGMNFKF